MLIGTLWPVNFDDSETEPDILETNPLQVIAQSDDVELQNKLKENVELTNTTHDAVEHTYKEEAASSVVDNPSSCSLNSEATPTTTSDNTSGPIMVNGTEVSSSSILSNDSISTTSPTAAVVVSTNSIDIPSNSTIPPPPPPPPPSSSSTPMTSPNAKTPTPTIATAIPSSHSAASVPAAYRQQTGLLGALPTAAALRTMPGAVYATAPGLANGLTGQVLYSGTKTNDNLLQEFSHQFFCCLS